MPVTTLDDLREHLQWAIQLEHATLPPYLCALYSIKPGTNHAAANVIASVFIEEMLHMTLAANVLNAVGGAPSLDKPDFIPRYPAYLPHSANAFQVSLLPFSPEAVDTFLKIERPEEASAPAEAEGYETIGQFYQAIEEGLRLLCGTLGEKQVFTGDPARQITPDTFQYSGSGRVVPVYDLASALAAIDEIEEQGEGLKHAEVWDGDRDMYHPEREEVAHYFRFMEITQGRSFRRGDSPASGPTGPAFEVDWSAVYPMRPNPRSQDFHGGSAIVARMGEFNLAYSDLLRDLHRTFNGEPGRLFKTIPAMLQLKQLAQALMQMPSGDGTTHAGPSFEYMPPVVEMRAANASFSIKVLENGPYLVVGGVPLNRKSVVFSELHEPLTWRKDATLESDATYRLCRCGQSSHKPFCDNTHARVGFNGTETASTTPSAQRARRFVGTNITMTDDSILCMHGGFCGNHAEKVWQMMDHTDDTRVRFTVMQMVERCPSGKLGYEVDGVPIEPDLPAAISVTKDGPLWVTGGIPVTMSNGQTLEVRNRVTLCRCGQSKNKPLCDGTHADAGFREG
ncbi:MAG TPA: ferritin-like domain-containing protein [Vicinamibacterales bacterium]|nr:ferritin-like domain-containing protein [Vicinamibacterales bacterium]